MPDKRLAALLLALLSLLVNQSLRADAAGLNLSTDGPMAHYLRPNVEYDNRWAGWLGLHQQRLSLLTSQESARRNLLLRASAELLDQRFTLPWTEIGLTPRAILIAANLFGADMVALAGGISHAAPKGRFEYIPFDLTLDAFFAPKITTFSNRNHYLWGWRLQADFPLPNNNELNLGYRDINTSLNGAGARTIERGLYLGLTTYF